MNFSDVLRDWAVRDSDTGEWVLKPDAPSDAKKIFQETYEQWRHPKPDENGIVSLID